MKKHLLYWSAVIGITAAFTSCAYGPYDGATNVSYSSGYNSGYGQGYGYGGSGFSTSVFVSTGNPRWGYDPTCYSYYDYTRRCYYDPYLYGYYPVGYRPRVVYGVPHPYGWRPGNRYCSPPRTIRNVTVVNYHDRERAYRNSNYSWSRNVRYMPESRNHSNDHRQNHNESYRSNSGPQNQNWNRSGSGRAPGSFNSPNFNGRGDQEHDRGNRPYQGRPSRDAQLPPSYNAPVTSRPEMHFNEPQQSTRGESRQKRFRESDVSRKMPESHPKNRQNFQRQAPESIERPQAEPQNPRGEREQRSSRKNKELRSLGDG